MWRGCGRRRRAAIILTIDSYIWGTYVATNISYTDTTALPQRSSRAVRVIGRFDFGFVTYFFLAAGRRAHRQGTLKQTSAGRAAPQMQVSINASADDRRLSQAFTEPSLFTDDTPTESGYTPKRERTDELLHIHREREQREREREGGREGGSLNRAQHSLGALTCLDKHIRQSHSEREQIASSRTCAFSIKQQRQGGLSPDHKVPIVRESIRSDAL